MAASDSFHGRFLAVCGDAFCFEDECIEADCRAGSPQQRLIGAKDNNAKFLYLDGETKKFHLKDLNDNEKNHSDNKFFIRTCLKPQVREGEQEVTLYATKSSRNNCTKNLVICWKDDDTTDALEMDPTNITDDKAKFYMKGSNDISKRFHFKPLNDTTKFLTVKETPSSDVVTLVLSSNQYEAFSLIKP